MRCSIPCRLAGHNGHFIFCVATAFQFKLGLYIMLSDRQCFVRAVRWLTLVCFPVSAILPRL
ncbi:hypothetical protein K450DRAFT_249219 [Umbelopsis ramanniana AG]|uniref:Uncharacterized protein n=1 Tax=Umbelopsis ramanniana AG TaxID=1314678 RepID=A0AAD5E6T8_UMBRA|nr:uncharacterized protein K450DRAFT_249219 [Umbelopsis ramanniana AG]KAI8577957.1 hypothetical protein K450DRAFT_249219 [Umbelopsis ramanniana AG]